MYVSRIRTVILFLLLYGQLDEDIIQNTADDIISAVCQHYGLKQREIVSKSRKQNIAQARQLAMYLIHKYTDLSYSQIGRRFGGRDHSTVLHGCNQVARRISVEKAFRHEVEELEAVLKK